MKALRLTGYLVVPMAIALLFLSAFKMGIRLENVKGSGTIKEETRSLRAYNSVATSGNFSVYIDPAGKTDIRMEADDNLMPYIETEVKGHNLDISIKKGYNIKPSKQIRIYVSIASLESLSSSGGGGFYSEGSLKGDNVKIGISGSTESDLDLSARAMKIDVSGSSKISLKGAITDTKYSVSGAAKVEALNLVADNVAVGISGSGKMEVYAQKKLDISVSGVGDIRYKGNPVVNQSSSGSAKISKID